MLYYNSSGNLIDFNLEEPSFNGKSAQIFLIDDICFKQYYKYSTSRVRMNIEMFNIIKQLDSPNIYKLLDYFYENERIDAYEYLYIKDTFVDIIKWPTEYLLYNLERLENIINIFTELKIWIKDFKRENVVYSNDDIILIDLDCCKVTNYNNMDDIYANNKNCLINLFIDLFEKCRGYSYIYENKVDNLFSIGNNNSVTSSVTKKLSKYKSPIEFIKD
jgi:hypothetical protein